MTVAVGDRLPDITVLDPSGQDTSLAALRTEDTLLIFLRHLA